MSKGKLDALNKLGNYVDGLEEKPKGEDTGMDEQLKKGIEVEMSEHGMDEMEATQTAKDHLAEDPQYYDKLKEMESDTGSEEEEFDDGFGAPEEETPKLSISVLARKGRPNFAKKGK